MDCEDIFGSSLNLEEIHLKEGYDEGYADGFISGKEEGQQVGLKSGFQVGEELGFYRGCIHVWNSAIRFDPNYISSRIHKTIKQMDDLLQKYPMLESVSDTMDALRLKFRAICASLNFKLVIRGHPEILNFDICSERREIDSSANVLVTHIDERLFKLV